MKVRVRCYAGHRGDEEPLSFDLEHRRLEVMEIVDRWLSPDHRYFKVKVHDAKVYILRHDDNTGEWELTS